MDEDLESLIQEITQLLGNKQQFVNPVIPASPSANPINSTNNSTNFIPGGTVTIQSPIHGTFYNSGGFSLVSPNPRHPKGHMGVDMRTSAGTPVYAAGPGIISNVGSNSVGGNNLSIQHGNGLSTYYAHLSTVSAQKGDKVDNNSIIGAVGNTGDASVTFPHLHFQVMVNGTPTDPAKYFNIPKYTDVDKSKEKFWTSDQAKQDAQAFNMQKHLENRKIAFSGVVDGIAKLAHHFYKLTKNY